VKWIFPKVQENQTWWNTELFWLLASKHMWLMMLSTSDPYTVPDFDVELAVLNFWGSLRFAPTLTQTHLHHGAQTGRYAWTEWLDELNWWLCNVFRGMSRGFQIFCCGKPVMNPILDPHSGEFSRAHRGSSIFFWIPNVGEFDIKRMGMTIIGWALSNTLKKKLLIILAGCATQSQPGILS